MKHHTNVYYDVQEAYDDLTIQAKESGQQQAATIDKHQVALNIIKNMNPDADAPQILHSLIASMETFEAVAKQFDDDVKNGCENEDALLTALGEIVVQYKPYECILYYLYPHHSFFINMVYLWFMNKYVHGDDGKA